MKSEILRRWAVRRGLVLGFVFAMVALGMGSCAVRSPEKHIHQLKSMQKVERTKAANELIRFDADEVVPLLMEESGSGYIRVRFEVANLLEQQRQGVITRPMGGYGLPEWIRLSIGTAKENQRAAESLKAALA